jgi:hypothetical protein
LSWSRLKGDDANRASIVRAAAAGVDCDVVLALADVHEVAPLTRAVLAMRPVIGAAGALLAVVVVRSSLGGASFEASANYAIALAAGFSERLASRATSRAIDSLQA